LWEGPGARAVREGARWLLGSTTGATGEISGVGVGMRLVIN
jgi:hypothetical protein